MKKQSSHLQLFERDTLDNIEKLVKDSEAKKTERTDVNLKNGVEKKIITGIHQVFGKIFDNISYKTILRNLLKNIALARIKNKKIREQILDKSDYKKTENSHYECALKYKQIQTFILKNMSTNRRYALPSIIQKDAHKILQLYDIKHIATPYKII